MKTVLQMARGCAALFCLEALILLWPLPLAAQQQADADMPLLWIGGIALGLFGGMLFWNRRLAQEIRRRTQIEAVLRESERRYLLLAENISDVIWVLNMEGRLIYISPSIERLRGYTPEEAMRQSLKEMLTPASFAVAQQAFHEFLARQAAGERLTERRRFEFEQLRKDGSTIWVEMTTSVMYDDAGACLGVLGVSRDISERKQAEQAFNDSEERFRLLIQHSNDIVVIAEADGRQRYVSPAAERITGFPPEELQQKTIFEIAHPDDVANIVDVFTSVLQHPHTLFSLTYRHICKDGSYKYLEAVGQNMLDHPLIHGVIGNTRDVSEWKRAEIALEQERQRLFAVLDTLPAAIYLQAKDYSIPFANRRFKELFGEPGTRRCYEHLHGRQSPCEDCQTFRVFTHKSQEVLEWTSPAGQTYIIYIMLFPSPDGEEMALEFWLDITAQKQVEAELVIAKEAADAGNRAKTEFLATMSHELRTPLNGILGYAQLLLRDASLSDKHHAHVEIIERSGNHLLQVINDILDLSNIEAQRMTLQPIDMLLMMFLEGIAEPIKERARQKGLAFTLDADDDLPVSVSVDEARLRQVLMNLLGNAVKFTKQGRIALRVTRRPNAAAPSHVTLRFEVSDTGPGIPSEQFTTIFSPFSQLARYHRTIEGTGLGLAICQRLVRLMGGELCVTSALNTGSAFWFELTLPVGRASLPIAPKISRLTTPSKPLPLHLPSQEILLQLIEYAALGDILALREEIERLANDAEFRPFAMSLQHYANTFQMDKIRAVLTSDLQQGANS